jgi:hypothetical protein
MMRKRVFLVVPFRDSRRFLRLPHSQKTRVRHSAEMCRTLTRRKPHLRCVSAESAETPRTPVNGVCGRYPTVAALFRLRLARILYNLESH